MKNIMLVTCFLLTGTALAQSRPIFPQISNFGNSIQLQIFNPNLNPVFCSGSVTINVIPRGMETHYVNVSIPPRMNVVRQIWPRQVGGRIANAYHSLFCR